MADEIRNLEAVKAKSEELQIPYANLLSAFVIEEAVLAISESEESENFRLKNDSILSLEYYRRKTPIRLEYMLYSEEELTVRGIIHRMSLIFQNERRAEFRWKYQVEKIRDNIRVHLTGSIEGLEIPIELLINRQTDITLKPSKEELHMFLWEDRTVEYLHYPVEGLLAEHFMRIMKNMELLNDLSSYYILYDLLKKEMNSARKVTEQLEILTKENHIRVRMSRFQMFCQYRESPYMKKRWKAYLKKEKKETPSFEEVMNVLIMYFKPIWEALVKGSYYLGDWMPELLRYLD